MCYFFTKDEIINLAENQTLIQKLGMMTLNLCIMKWNKMKHGLISGSLFFVILLIAKLGVKGGYAMRKVAKVKNFNYANKGRPNGLGSTPQRHKIQFLCIYKEKACKNHED